MIQGGLSEKLSRRARSIAKSHGNKQRIGNRIPHQKNEKAGTHMIFGWFETEVAYMPA
jgi:hypothetical protein